jgi:glutaredoxin
MGLHMTILNEPFYLAKCDFCTFSAFTWFDTNNQCQSCGEYRYDIEDHEDDQKWVWE